MELDDISENGLKQLEKSSTILLKIFQELLKNIHSV